MINEIWSIKTLNKNYTHKKFVNATPEQTEKYLQKLMQVGSKVIGVRPL